MLPPPMYNYDYIPDEMKNLPQWVGARNNSKLPLMYGKRGVEAASVTDPRAWCTFDKITEIAVKKFDNIGFVFNENGIIGIDIDKGFDDDGFLSPIAIDIMSACRSFTEYSRSGRGMHIYVKGKLPFDGRNNRKGVEIYQRGRYFIVTGRKLIFSELIENQEAIDYVVEKYFTEMVVISGKKTTPNIYQPKRTMTIGDTLKIETEYPEIAEGGRNISLTSLAGQLHNQGYTEQAIYDEVCRVNRKCCKPPLDLREVKNIVKSVMRYRRV